VFIIRTSLTDYRLHGQSLPWLSWHRWSVTSEQNHGINSLVLLSCIS